MYDVASIALVKRLLLVLLWIAGWLVQKAVYVARCGRVCMGVYLGSVELLFLSQELLKFFLVLFRICVYLLFHLVKVV